MDDLERCISEYTAVPRSSFFLTFQGKMISADQVKSMDFGGPIPVVMHGRLRGGSAIPGAWVCNVCNASGCWPTKSRCFRCGHARDSRITSGASGSSPPAGREKAHPGRAPRAKAAPVNPTFRPPRVIPPKKSSSPAAAAAPPVSPQAQVSPDLLVATLRALGIGEDLLTQIQTSIKPPAPKVERKEQRLFQLRGLIDTKKAQVAKLERSENHHRSQLEVCITNRQQRAGELAALQEEYRSVAGGKLSPNSTPAASVVSSKEPDESCDSDLMDDETPPLPPAEGQPSVFGLPGPPMDDPVQGIKAIRLKTSDPNTPAHGVGHDPALFGQHIALCSDDELDMYLKEIQKRRDAIVDAAASGILTGDFESEVPEV